MSLQYDNNCQAQFKQANSIEIELNLALLLIPPTQPPIHPDRKSSDLAGFQQNLHYNIDR